MNIRSWIRAAFVGGLLASLASPAAEKFDCLLEPYLVVDASTAVEGVLEEVPVDRGDRVRKGQVVATLRSRVERAALAQAEARARGAAKQGSLEVRSTQRRAKLDRAEGLGGQNFITPDELDDLRSEVSVAEFALAEEAERIELAKLEVERVKSLLEMRTIRSPIDGVVVKRYLYAGEFAQAKPILRIAQIDPLYVEVVMPVAFYGRITQGMDAIVEPQVPVGTRFEARVKVLDKVVDAASGTFGVRLLLPNPQYALTAGLECQVSFPALE